MRSLLLPFLLAFAPALCVKAQRVFDLQADGNAATVMVRATNGPAESAVPVLQGTWRIGSNGASSFAYQQLTNTESGASLALDQFLLAGIEQYLDQRVHFEKQGVHTDVPVDRMLLELQGMVRSACEEFHVGEGFGGFTEATGDQLERVTHIDWSQAKFGVDGGEDQDKYLAIYYYVRTQRQELERQFRADLLPLASVNIVEPATAEAPSPGRTLEVPTVCRTVFDDQNYLCALDLAVDDTLMSLPDPRLTERMMANLAEKARAEKSAVNEPKLRKRDRWLKTELDRINERIDQLDQRKELWAMRDRLDDMQGRIDDIGLQVNELKEGSARPVKENPIANLSDLTGRNITVRFSRGATEVDAQHRMVLNEVFEQMARMPDERVLITGYTDRSGDPAVNLALSEQRAKAVRAYLLQRGIASDRLLVNYYGDSRSSGRDPEERRVEVEWLR